MKLFSKKAFDDANAILSFATALVAVAQLCLHVPWHYFPVTLGFVLLAWMLVGGIRLHMRPWAKKMRNPLIARPFASAYPFGTFFKTVFTKPYYETSFISPLFSSKRNGADPVALDTSRLTVVVEDDPVGYADNIGMLPCIPVQDEVTQADLLEQLEKLGDEIADYNMFFIATPSRRMSKEQSLVLNREIGLALRRYLAGRATKEFRIISKIDSCLRSNYEAEFDGLTDGLGMRDCLEILVPSYVEQGRVTLHGSQYINVGGKYKLIEDSEYASFKGLEYHSSDLALWLEHAAPHVRGRKKVGLVDIDVLRTQSPDEIARRILDLATSATRAFVFDTVEPDDLTLVAQVIQTLENSGKTLFLKFGPSMINQYAGAFAKPREKNTLSNIRRGDHGIVIAGSLTSTTKRQIENYDDSQYVSIVTVREADLDNIQNVDNTIASRSNKIMKLNKNGDDVILTTEYWKTDKNEYPDIQKRDTVLSILAKICRQIRHSPSRWFLLKGSDTALFTVIHGLEIRHYYYCGQYIPGVIHCKCICDGGLKSFFIIGGNVGTPSLLTSLRKAINDELGPGGQRWGGGGGRGKDQTFCKGEKNLTASFGPCMESGQAIPKSL